MKRTFYLLTATLFLWSLSNSSKALQAQNTLAFDSVRLVSSASQTVPSDETWKIVSLTTAYYYLITSSGCGNSARNASVIQINGTNYYFNTGLDYGGSAVRWGSGRFPFWVPPGTTIRTICTQSLLSVITFKIQ
jgi:hypothetical protein